MSYLDNLTLGVEQIAHWAPLLAIVAGVLIGIAIGVLPGLSASTGVALLLPFSWFLDPAIALILFGAVYTAAEYGGCITAIAINTPGEPSSVVTALDGYPLTKQGRMGEALSVSLWTSVVGGLIGTVALVLFAPVLAEFALSFGPAEYVALGALGLTLSASLSAADYLKGTITTLAGLLLATFGQDPMTGSFRFTFGEPELIEGIALIPAMIGLFAASEVFAEIVSSTTIHATPTVQTKRRMRLSELWALKRVTMVGSVIGTVIGVIPGAGTTIASLISYNEARRFSKEPGKFGSGSLEGVAAAESANNACVGGALIPMLTLGLPGSGTTAVMLGALVMHGLQPGPELFRTSQSLVYGLFVSLFLANIVMLVVALGGVRLWLFVMRAPKPVLMTIIMGICVIGAYGENNSLFGVAQMLVFGFLGYLLKKYDYPVATVVLGLVLGFMMETNLRRAVLMGGWGSFLHSPLALGMLILAVISVALVVVSTRRERRKLAEAEVAAPVRAP